MIVTKYIGIRCIFIIAYFEGFSTGNIERVSNFNLSETFGSNLNLT